MLDVHMTGRRTPMGTKSWDELEETDPQRAEAYRDAIAELTDWVIERARGGVTVTSSRRRLTR
jgi:hypothetical protein